MTQPPSPTELPIIQYWDEDEPPAEVAALIATFAPDRTGMPHLIFNRRTAEEFLAERFGARHVEAFRSCAVPAMQSDYFRYCAVHALGGVYIDADFFFRRDLRPLLTAGGQLFEQPPRGPVLNNLFAFQPQHPFLALTVEAATRNVEGRVSNNVALATGPAIFTGLLQLSHGRPAETLRELVRPAWRRDVDACREQLVESLDGAVAVCGPVETALEGVQISTRAEMLTWVDRSKADLPYKQGDRYWANWKGSIFCSPERGGVR